MRNLTRPVLNATINSQKNKVVHKLRKYPLTLPPYIPTMSQIHAKKKMFYGVSLFSGCGGSCLGHRMAGIDIRYANEFIPIARKTYEINNPGSFCDGSDIRTVNPKDILKKLGIKKGELPFLDGSPPCSPFSTAGTRNKDWGEEKNYSEGVKQRVDDLFFEFCRILKGLMPWVFVAENVTGLIKGDAKGYFREIIIALKDCGYIVKAFKVNSSWLGVPQARERIIYVGIRKDLAELYDLKPVSPKPFPRQVTVKEMLPHIAYIKSKKKGVLKYIPADVPHPTITASDGLTSPTAQFSTGGFVETFGGEQRKYTIQELKVICGYPRDFRLIGKFHQRWERLGRSVPPQMMFCISKTIRDNLLKVIADGSGLDYTKGPIYGKGKT
jgi:DNA (cytosine-5)-methyltransferase 1